MAELDAAIVIAVLNEAANLGDLLDDCAAQDPPPREVIVVDAGSSDGTVELVDARRAHMPALHLVRAPGALPGAARNAGIERAEAAVIATVDGGSRVGPGWLDALVARLREAGPGRVVVGVPAPDTRSEFERALGWFTLRAFKPADAPGPVGPAFRPAGRNGYCFSKAAWRAAGGYPSELRWSEDKLFLERLRAAGNKVVVAHDAVVRWRPRGSLPEVYAQYRGYGRGDVIAGVDRQNELVPLAMYAAGGALAGRALQGHRWSGVALVAGATAYLGLFVAAAAPELRPSPALAWVPVIRVTADVAKIHGLISATWQKLAGR